MRSHMAHRPVFFALILAFLAGVFLLTGDALAEDKDAAPGQMHTAGAQTRINGVVLTQEQIGELEATYGVRPLPGDYWYDARSGLYGVVGQQAMGSMLPGHSFGKLRADASKGNSGVFMNGRELTMVEVGYINILLGGLTLPGRYWLDANGNCGIEGLDVPLVNFYVAAQSRFNPGGGEFQGGYDAGGDGYGYNYDAGGGYQGGYDAGGGGDNFWSSQYGAGNYDSDNSRGYVSVPGHGPVGYGF